MNSIKCDDKFNIIISDIFDNPKDMYAFIDFGKFVNNYNINQDIISSKFWGFLKSEYNIKNKNILIKSTISYIEGKEDKICKYVVKIDKPYKLLLMFDEYDDIHNMSIYFDHQSIDYVESDLLTNIKKCFSGY